MPRFVLHALDNEEDATDGEWQVCRFQSCELQGKGLANFLETLIPGEDLKEGKKGRVKIMRGHHGPLDRDATILRPQI